MTPDVERGCPPPPRPRPEGGSLPRSGARQSLLTGLLSLSAASLPWTRTAPPAGGGDGRARRSQGAVDAGGPAFAVGGVFARGPEAPAARRYQDGDHVGPHPRRLLRGSRHAPVGGTGRLRRPSRRTTVSGDTEARTGGVSGQQGVDLDDQVLREGRQAGRVRVALPEAVLKAAHEGFGLVVEPTPATPGEGRHLVTPVTN